MSLPPPDRFVPAAGQRSEKAPPLRPPLPALPPQKLRLASKPDPRTIDQGDALLERVLDRMEVLDRSKRRRRLGRFAITFLLCAALAAGIAAIFWRRFEEIHFTWPWRF